MASENPYLSAIEATGADRAVSPWPALPSGAFRESDSWSRPPWQFSALTNAACCFTLPSFATADHLRAEAV
jgi:hypothetical protein